mgnify:CR=1 FL=1
MMKCIITKPTLSLKSSVAPCKVITVQKLSQGDRTSVVRKSSTQVSFTQNALSRSIGNTNRFFNLHK